MKLLLFIAALLLVQHLALAEADFITTPGDYQPFPETSVRVTIENDKVHYHIGTGSGGASPTKSDIDPKSNWFIFPETAGRFWIHSGTGRLLLIEFEEQETRFTGSEVVPDLLKRAPEAVKNRLSSPKGDPQ